jgi:hypothetical protein
MGEARCSRPGASTGWASFFARLNNDGPKRSGLTSGTPDIDAIVAVDHNALPSVDENHNSSVGTLWRYSLVDELQRKQSVDV